MSSTLLSRFTPSTMPAETLEAIFVQRHDIVKRTVDLIADSVETGGKHHHLFIGRRGIGKTHLISLIYHRVIARPDLRDRLLAAWLKEEEWGVTSFLDFLLRVLRALHEEYSDHGLAEATERLYRLEPSMAVPEAGEVLRRYAREKTLLLVENVDDVFQGLGDVGQKQMRAYIQETPFWTTVATSQSLFNGVSLRSSPYL